jgi:tRNA G18 (ribose-2'-O)-methylase SpoU
MRGYFCIGVEGVSKAMNVGTLFRSAHAFGASMIFTVAASYEARIGNYSDTAKSSEQVPFYAFPDIAAMMLPGGCKLVGIEIDDQAVELPSFRHPRRAAYVLGSERFGLTPEMTVRCDHLVKIPTAFSVNLGIAGAIVMYDRLLSLGRFAQRPQVPGGLTEPLPEHVFGTPRLRKKLETFRTPLPAVPSGRRER